MRPTRPMEASSVTLERVSHHYDGAVTVSGVDLKVLPGEFLTLIGPSGSGKTTLLRIVGGLVKPTAGRVLIGAVDVTDAPARSRSVGFVFQNYALFPHYSVFDNVAYPLGLRKVPAPQVKERVTAALDLVQLAGLERRFPGQLSGGQQQRVALARAIVFDPAVLLLDEPLGALDRRLRQQLAGELKRIQRETGLTAIFVTHDQEEAFLSDRIAVIHRGRIMQVGAPDEVYDRPADLFVAEFLGEVSLIRGSVVSSDAAGVAIGLPRGRVIHGVSAAALQAGEPVVAVVRPERVKLGSGPGGHENALDGKAVAVRFLGTTRSFVVDDETLRLRVQTIAPEAPVREGDGVSVWWRPSDTLVFPDKPENSS